MKHRIAPLGLLIILGSARLNAAHAQAPGQGVEPIEEPTDAPAEAEAPAEGEVPTAVAEAPAEAEAGAAEAPAEAPVELNREDEDIVVTGTRIKQTSFSNASPVEVIGRKQFEQTGVSTLAQALQYLTVSQGSATNATVNLRGLGAGATLVLVNGRRMNPSAATGLAGDVSTIPLSAVERLEIMKAGAAAIYGADAVGGVVNIITRRAWNGVRGQIDGKMTADTAFGEVTGSASFGSVSERSRVSLAGNYFYRNELTALDRDNLTRGRYVSTQGYPGAFLVPQDPTPDMPRPPPRLMTDPACGFVLNTKVVPTVNGQTCTDDYRPGVQLLTPLERLNAFGSGEFDLTDHATVFGELTFSRTRGSFSVMTYGVLPPYPVVPANHVDNPFGKDVQWMGRPRGGREATEPQTTTTADDTVRMVLGLKGDLAGVGKGSVIESWNWEIYGTAGLSRYRRAASDNLRTPLQMALNSCSDPANLTKCFNPFYTASTGQGTANSQDVINSIAGRLNDVTDHNLQTLNAGLSGTLFDLPGGELGMAVGAEVREEQRALEVDNDFRKGEYGFLGGSNNLRASRSVYSGYLELRWPLLKGLEIQTAARVEHYNDIGSSPISPFAGLTWEPGRTFDMEHSAPTFSSLQLRANVSRAFRAPTIFQTYPGAATVATPLQRQGMTAVTWIPVATAGNKNLQPETAYTVTSGLSFSPLRSLTLSADFWYYNYRDRIQAESAAQILGVWEISGGTMGLYNDPRVAYDAGTNTVGPIYVQTINVAGSVITSGLDFQAMLNLGRREVGAGALSISPSGTYTLTHRIPRRETTLRSFTNAAGMNQRLGPKGCSGSADVDLDMDPKNNAQNDLDSCEVAGSRNYNNIAPPLPRLKFNVPVTWSLLEHHATVLGHYISSYDDDVEPLPDGELSVIPAVFTLDLEYGYTMRDVIGKTFGLRVGVENVLDTLPPIVHGPAVAFDGETHDPRGRVVYAKLSGEF